MMSVSGCGPDTRATPRGRMELALSDRFVGAIGRLAPSIFVSVISKKRNCEAKSRIRFDGIDVFVRRQVVGRGR